jgi:hypothetical protein
MTGHPVPSSAARVWPFLLQILGLLLTYGTEREEPGMDKRSSGPVIGSPTPHDTRHVGRDGTGAGNNTATTITAYHLWGTSHARGNAST